MEVMEMAVKDVEKSVVPLSAQGLWTRKGQRRPTPMPSLADLQAMLESVEHTWSEVLVLLYEVVQNNQVLSEHVCREPFHPGAWGGAGRTRSVAGDVGPLMEAETMLKTETTQVPGAGTGSIRPMPTTEDLARSIQALDTTLSEVLVLLYHVVQANHNLVESLRQQRPLSLPSTRPAEMKPPLVFATRTDQ